MYHCGHSDILYECVLISEFILTSSRYDMNYMYAWLLMIPLDEGCWGHLLKKNLYILNVINILVYINSSSNNTSSASVMLCCLIVHSVIR